MRLILTQDWSLRTSRVKSKMDRSSQEKVKSQRDKHLVRLPWGMGKMGRDRLLRWAARQREVLVVLIILRLAHWHTLLHLGLQIRLPDPEIRGPTRTRRTLVTRSLVIARGQEATCHLHPFSPEMWRQTLSASRSMWERWTVTWSWLEWSSMTRRSGWGCMRHWMALLPTTSRTFRPRPSVVRAAGRSWWRCWRTNLTSPGCRRWGRLWSPSSSCSWATTALCEKRATCWTRPIANVEIPVLLYLMPSWYIGSLSMPTSARSGRQTCCWGPMGSTTGSSSSRRWSCCIPTSMWVEVATAMATVVNQAKVEVHTRRMLQENLVTFLHGMPLRISWRAGSTRMTPWRRWLRWNYVKDFQKKCRVNYTKSSPPIGRTDRSWPRPWKLEAFMSLVATTPARGRKARAASHLALRLKVAKAPKAVERQEACH